jgi:transposase
MPKARLQVTRSTPEEIHMLLRKDEKYIIGVKLYAIYQIASGFVSRDLEKIYNVSFKSICTWVNEYNQNGVDGLINVPKSGRKPRLKQEQKEAIKYMILNEEPTKYNYNTSTWTGPILIDFIEKKYGIQYKKAQIYNIMKSLGLTYQKGKGKYPEADKKKREIYMSELKKNLKPKSRMR